MSGPSVKFLCLLQELEVSHKLIRSGFGSLQEIDMSNDFYELPQMLMASGLERLMKCYISLAYEDRYGSFPDKKYMKKLGHDLECVLQEICDEFYGGKHRPMVASEFDFITSDSVLLESVQILSLFGKAGRYYNLDVVAGGGGSPIDPRDEWERLETQVVDVGPYLTDQESLHRDYYPKVHSEIIGRLERLVRAVALQFTLGDHPDQFRRIGQSAPVYSDFRNLRDEQLGTIDYRRSVRILRQETKKKWVRRDDREILKGRSPTRVLTESEAEVDWPFRADRVILECREKLACVVSLLSHKRGGRMGLNRALSYDWFSNNANDGKEIQTHGAQ